MCVYVCEFEFLFKKTLGSYIFKKKKRTIHNSILTIKIEEVYSSRGNKKFDYENFR